MKIVIDLQAMQGESRHRGIGRYCADITRAFVQIARNKCEIWLVLNAQLGHVERVRAWFEGLVPQDRIVTYSTIGATASIRSGGEWRSSTSEILREDFLNGLEPDIVWLTSLFEGWIDDCITSIGRIPTDALCAVTIYDLIPLSDKQAHLADERLRNWYYQKLGFLKRADALLTISQYTKSEVTELLDIPAEQVIDISTATSSTFCRINLSIVEIARIKNKFALMKPFVLYVGGYDDRKNVGFLISAYAKLSFEIRERHCLLLAGRITESASAQLRILIRKHGLTEGEVVFTGQIDDPELAALYNLCDLFVFPSLQEGFGLPVLEAMACGAPVLAARATSLPEVVGRNDMLFDLGDSEELARKMAGVLCSVEVREELSRYGQVRAQKFSWEGSAQRVMDSFERLMEAKSAHATQPDVQVLKRPRRRLRLAYVSPLPPERTGIADYSAELLVDLGNYYDIDVVVEQDVVTDEWVSGNYPVRKAAWFDKNAAQFDRILYQFGNSPFHLYQLPLLRKHPGTVVLHDFFIGAFSQWRASAAKDPDAYLRRLYQSHGYGALVADANKGRDFTISAFPSNLEIIQSANGVLVHSQYAIDQAARCYGVDVASSMRRVAFPKRQYPLNRVGARMRLGVAHDDFVVCSFGLIAPTKLNERLLDAWLRSRLARDMHCRLVFVGENHGGEYGRALLARMQEGSAENRVQITGFAGAADYRAWLEAADVAVQLRTDSRGETSAAVFDCMAQGLPLIVNAHATFVELDSSAVLLLPDVFTEDELVDKLHQLYDSAATRNQLSDRSREVIRTFHHPSIVVGQYERAIEHFAARGKMWREREVARAIGRLSRGSEHDLMLAAFALSRNQPALRQKQLLVDVSAIARNDLKTGIERVTRQILREWIGGAVEEFRVEPIRFHQGQYVYARAYACSLIGIANPSLREQPVEVSAGDIFYGLDWAADIVSGLVALFQSWRDRGVGIYFTVHDLLPVLRPDIFPAEIAPMHATWLRSIAACADGLVCVSKTVAAELKAWLGTQDVERKRSLAIGYNYSGADLDVCSTRAEQSPADLSLLESLTDDPVVLMVATVEPRKGHALALDAFELLWRQGSSAHLVIVGKQGWMADSLAKRVRMHGEFGKRLHWLDGISDAYLDRLYEAADVLLAASEGEGFGLPLIEAARRGLPIIARDIPVFREVAGNAALFFEEATAIGLAQVLDSWFALNAAGNVPPAEQIKWSSWRQSAITLGEMITNHRHANWLYALPEGGGAPPCEEARLHKSERS